MRKSTDKGAEVAFFCNGPLNLLNAIVFVLSNELNSKGKSDLYIGGEFRDAEMIAERIRQRRVFENVYFVEDFLNLKGNKIMHKISALFFPKHTLIKYSNNTVGYKIRYSKICYFSSDFFALVCLRVFKYDSLIRLDDGLGSYFGNIALRASKKMLFLHKYVFRGKLIQPFTKLYLNCPEFYKGELENIICKMPEIQSSREICDTLFEVFQYQKNNLYNEHKVVFLTQYFSSHYNYKTEKKILDLLQELYGDRFLVRIHPRQKTSDYDSFYVDQINNMWELECLEQLKGNNVLISVYSTAQVFPKLLFDKEPYVIFLYKLMFDNVSDNMYCKDADSLISSLTNAYKHKNRIYVPTTFEELIIILNSLKDEVCENQRN